MSTAELSIPNFIFLRNDRTRHGGGCCIYVHSSLDYTCPDSLHVDCMETLWCNIKPCSGSPFLLGCIYRPPSSNIQCFNKIVDNIEKAIVSTRTLLS